MEKRSLRARNYNSPWRGPCNGTARRSCRTLRKNLPFRSFLMSHSPQKLLLISFKSFFHTFLHPTCILGEHKVTAEPKLLQNSGPCGLVRFNTCSRTCTSSTSCSFGLSTMSYVNFPSFLVTSWCLPLQPAFRGKPIRARKHAPESRT